MASVILLLTPVWTDGDRRVPCGYRIYDKARGGIGKNDLFARQLFSALTDAGYRGAVCIEVEDRAYEGSLEDRQRALRQSKRFLEQWVPG